MIKVIIKLLEQSWEVLGHHPVSHQWEEGLEILNLRGSACTVFEEQTPSLLGPFIRLKMELVSEYCFDFPSLVGNLSWQLCGSMCMASKAVRLCCPRTASAASQQLSLARDRWHLLDEAGFAGLRAAQVPSSLRRCHVASYRILGAR